MIYITQEQQRAYDEALVKSGKFIASGKLVEDARDQKNEVCLNEQYDRGYVQGLGDDIVRYISCPCSKCNP